MVTARRDHASCTLAKYLYVFFGKNVDGKVLSIERLAVDDLDAEWEPLYDFQGNEYPIGRE